MISRRMSSVTNKDVFPILLYCVSRCSQTCCGAPPYVACAPRHVAGAPCLVACAPRCSRACHRRSQACRRRSQMLPGASKGLSGPPRCSQTSHNHSHGTSVPVIRGASYSEGRQECPPRVWDSPEIDASKFALHILSDTPGGFQWLKYILLMWWWWLLSLYTMQSRNW